MNLSTVSPLMPPPVYNTKSSDFSFDELVSAKATFGRVGLGDLILSVKLPTSLLDRKIYGFYWGTPVAPLSEYWVKGELELIRNHTVAVRLPVAWGAPGTAGTACLRSLPSLVTSTNLPCIDAINLVVCNPAHGEPQNPILVPMTVCGEFDEVGFRILDAQNVDDFRVFLACKSTSF